MTFKRKRDEQWMNNWDVKKIFIFGFILVMGLSMVATAQEGDPLNEELSLVTESGPALENDQADLAEVMEELEVNSSNDIQEYFEFYLNSKIAEYNLPGLAFAFVNQGQVVTRGYGYSDLENEIIVDPERTVFPLDSISKTFTATAVLQIVQDYDLDLTRDVNYYLDQFQFESKFARPITIKNLLTHTSGLANDPVESYTKERNQIKPLGIYLKNNIPSPIIGPGNLSIYSDYGYGLAGYLIELVSDLPFAEYMDINLFQPLRMNHTGYNWPPKLRTYEAIGYTEQDQNSLQSQARLYAQLSPASGLTSTVGDIANFIQMQLEGGIFNEEVVLDPKLVGYQQQLQFTQHPQLAGWTLGLHEEWRNGQRVLLHGGDISAGFSSIMFIIPDADFGMIIATNRFAPQFGTELVHDFMDWRYPETEVEPVDPIAGAADRRSWFTANYTLDYPAQSSLCKLRRLFTQIHVEKGESGTILVDFPQELRLPEEWIEIEPLLFRAVESDDYLMFIDDSYGKVTHLYAGGPHNFSRVPWYQTTEITLMTLLIFIIIFSVICLVWLVRRIRSRKRRGDLFDNFHQNMATLISVVNLLFIAGLIIYICFYWQELISEVNIIVSGLLLLPIISGVLTAILVIVGSSMRKQRWSFGLRLYHFLLNIVFVLFLIFLWNWNLFG